MTIGQDGIPEFLVKDCAFDFSVTLTAIFKLSLKNQHISYYIQKLSKVIPVFITVVGLILQTTITLICKFSKVYFLLKIEYYNSK